MKGSKPVVRFHFLKAFSLPARRELKEFIVSIFNKENHTLAQLDYIFCDDEYLLNINQAYLNHDTYTDIITFDLSDSIPSVSLRSAFGEALIKSKLAKSVTGEIYISIDRIKENSKLFNVSFQTELRRVIFHGALHLCGYKDKSPRDIKIMRLKEDNYLKMFHGKKCF